MKGNSRATMLQSPIEQTTRVDYSERTAQVIDGEIRRFIDEQRERATTNLSGRHLRLLRAAPVLLAKETISGHELRELIRADDAGEDSAQKHFAQATCGQVDVGG
jgi:cell division protease FtsH